MCNKKVVELIQLYKIRGYRSKNGSSLKHFIIVSDDEFYDVVAKTYYEANRKFCAYMHIGEAVPATTPPPPLPGKKPLPEKNADKTKATALKKRPSRKRKYIMKPGSVVKMNAKQALLLIESGQATPYSRNSISRQKEQVR